MKVVFFGSSNYCLPILEALKKNLQLVITRPDKPVGRKQVITPSPVYLWATNNRVPVITPSTLKKESPDRSLVETTLKELSPDIAVVADYGLIIPEEIFTIPKHGTFNIHFSKLPDLRGPSPVQFTLLRGDLHAWITIFKLEKTLDTGPILWQESFPISPNDTTQTLYSQLFQKAAKKLPEVIDPLLSQSTNQLVRQVHQNATFCRMLAKDDGFINWNTLQKAMSDEPITLDDLPKIQQEAIGTTNNLPVNQSTSSLVYNFYRSMTPWPGMFTLRQDQSGKSQRMIVRNCHLEGERLVLDEVQYEGKKPQKPAEIN